MFPFYAFLGLYTTFLTSEFHYPLAAAAAALSMFGLGPFFSPLAGYIGDRVNQKLFQIVSLATMAVIGYIIFNIAKTAPEHNILSLLEGLAGGFVYVNGYSLAQRSVRGSMVGRVSGFYYASTTLPAAVSGYVLAKLVNYFGWSHGATIVRDVSSISGLASPDQNARQPIRVQDHGNLQSVPLARVTTAVFRRAALAGARR